MQTAKFFFEPPGILATFAIQKNQQNMKTAGMIFAAGLGTRLRPFTLDNPKALVEVGGVPMLGRVIERMKNAGISDIVVNAYHFADRIIDYIDSNNRFGINISVSDERPQLLDTGGGIARAFGCNRKSDFDAVVVHNADILTDFPLESMIEAHFATASDATLLVDHRDSSRQLYFDRSGNLCGWKNLKSGAEIGECTARNGLAFGGVHIISPSLLPELHACSEKNEVFPIIPFYLDRRSDFIIKGFTPAASYAWFDVGRPETLAAARDFITNSFDNIRDSRDKTCSK